MSQPSLYRGDLVPGFSAAVVATGAGIAYALTPLPGVDTKVITWSYEFSIAPIAITIILEVSLDGINWFQYDTYTTFGTQANRKVDVGQNNFVRLNVTALTLGAGAGIGGHIGY